MLRYFIAACILACAVGPTFAGPPASPDESANASMRFEWWREGPAEACRTECRVWISATGYITGNTAHEFEAFANGSNTRGAVLVLDSEGGSVLGTLELGRAIRNLNIVTTVGKTMPLPPSADGDRRALLSPNGSCQSMCAFLLLAGSRRYVPAQAHVQVHQIWLGKKGKQAQRLTYSAEEFSIVQRDIGRLAQYTVEMGGTGELLETALRIPPWAPSRRLSADELQRMRLTTIDGPFERWVPRTSPGTTSRHETSGSRSSTYR
jgi:hypothetical protein